MENKTNPTSCWGNWEVGTKRHNALVGTALASTAILALCTAALLTIEKSAAIRNSFIGSLLSKTGPALPLLFVASSWTSLASLSASHLTLGKNTDKRWLPSKTLRLATKVIGFGVAGLWLGLLTHSALFNHAGRFVGWNKLAESLTLHLVAGGTFTAIIPAMGLTMAYAGRR